MEWCSHCTDKQSPRWKRFLPRNHKRKNLTSLFLRGILVNSVASKPDGFIEALSKIQGRIGKFSILGNHDYGIYREWKSEADKVTNDEHMKRIYAASGSNLLKNANRRLEKNGDYITILESKNWRASLTRSYTLGFGSFGADRH